MLTNHLQCRAIMINCLHNRKTIILQQITQPQRKSYKTLGYKISDVKISGFFATVTALMLLLPLSQVVTLRSTIN